MKLTCVVLALSLLAGCATSGYKTFYTPIVDIKTLTDVELLAKGEEPKVYGTNNFARDAQILEAKRYVRVGYSSFNGGHEDTKNAAAQARAIGATIVLVNSKYTNTQTTTSTLFLPDNKTTYHSGTASANTAYNGSYGYLGSSNTQATYSGTSTTYGTKTVPITTHQQRFDQVALYFVKSNFRFRFGLSMQDLTPSLRANLQRNTGALVHVVIEDTPAFYANILPGDILVAVDGIQIKNSVHAQELMANVSVDAKSSELMIMRNGENQSIHVQF